MLYNIRVMHYILISIMTIMQYYVMQLTSLLSKLFSIKIYPFLVFLRVRQSSMTYAKYYLLNILL